MTIICFTNSSQNINEQKLEPINARTYIGVVSQPNAKSNLRVPQNMDLEYSEIPSTYTAWIEQTGADVVLVPYDMPWGKLTGLLSNLNGIVLPGGGSRVIVPPIASNQLSPYGKRVIRILDWVKKTQLN